jgi:hypothetical protein
MPSPSEPAFLRLRCATGGQESAPRRHALRRRLTVAATGGSVAAPVVTGVVVAARSPVPTAVSASAGAVHPWAHIAPSGFGSSITLSLRGVPAEAQCRSQRDGHATEADAVTHDRVRFRGAPRVEALA